MREPFSSYADGQLYCGNVNEVLAEMLEESVDCIVTSPPYFGLRDYGVDGQVGLESTPEEYIARLVEVFRELRRVLKKDGVAWLNMGDSYWGGKGRSGAGSTQTHRERTSATLQKEHTYLGKKGSFRPTDRKHMTFKPKDLMMIPHRLAIALQEDGWWVRQEIVWHKPNPMPESVRDRCTKAHEYVFMLTKSKKYFYDSEAIKEPVVNPKRKNYQSGSRPHGENLDRNDNDWGSRSKNKVYEKKNKRTVWSIPPKSFKGAHFATFPPKLIEPCVLAGTSEAGHCVDCGSRYKRIVKRNLKNKPDTAKSLIESAQHMGIPDDKAKMRSGLDRKNAYEKNPGYQTLAWDATCDCDSPTEPDVVLDPFMGSGTTAIVARQHGRRFIGIDLNPEYLELADKRICSSE